MRYDPTWATSTERERERERLGYERDGRKTLPARQAATGGDCVVGHVKKMINDYFSSELRALQG